MSSEEGSTAIAIPSWSSRTNTITLTLFADAWAFYALFDRQHWWPWARHIPTPVPVVVVYVAAVAFASIWLLYRACRLEARFDDYGVTVRKLFRTHRYSWPEASHFAD
jgi:hypothetical protein